MYEVKERPIIFSGPMVRAILAGRKTQTRRVVIGIEIGPGGWPSFCKGRHLGNMVKPKHCPYGSRGDKLWVREAYNPGLKPERSRADGYLGCVYRADDFLASYSGGWTPSIHMPRRHSRITLEIVGVRVERLQEITYEDAVCEGITNYALAKTDFTNLWDTINAKRGYSWASNPLVWVIQFKAITPANNAMHATSLRVASAGA